jgi:hypothetical protein
MSYYSNDPAMVRVDFFKASGKWYCTEAVKWTGSYDKELIHDAFNKSLQDHFADQPKRLSDMDAICLEPYHKFSHPIQLKNGEWATFNIKRVTVNEPFDD